jgi:hypothetical protein
MFGIAKTAALGRRRSLPMNRDFEFKQLLRAYRAGIINEKTFEAEMAEIEHGANANGGNGTAGGFRYMGKTYKSERDAVVSFLDKSRAGEANGAEIFRNWAKVCTTDCIRSGLKMIAEREEVSAEGLKIKECASDPKMSDNAKLLDFNKILTNPDELIRPIFEFAELIKEDLETKEALRLFAEDELSSTKWLKYACAALNAPAAVASTTTNMVAMSEEM